MAATTQIEWADATANFWIGCTQISPACDGCYAKSYAEHFGIVEWNGTPKKCEAGRKVARAMQRHALATGETPVVFVNSLSDFFDKNADPAWRAEALEDMEAAPNVIFLLLTKRIGNVIEFMSVGGRRKWPANLRLGITVVNQPEADRDVPKLLATKAHYGIPWVFLSIEPMLGAIDLTALRASPSLELNALSGWATLGAVDGVGGIASKARAALDWVIVGGESGTGARPMHPDWARSLRDQCAAAGVPFFFKQWGEWKEWRHDEDGPHVEIIDTDEKAEATAAILARLSHPVGCVTQSGRAYATMEAWASSNENDPVRVMERLGKARAGRLLDGVEHNARPPLSTTSKGEALATDAASPGRSLL